MTTKTTPAGSAFSLSKYLTQRAKFIEDALEASLPSAGPGHPKLREAMRYCLLGAGKRFRPVLTLAACEACGGDWKGVLPAACAVEYVHAYSLAHDDLPAMDNAMLRRGRETCHRKYGEAMAILAGDALLTEAWRLIAAWGAQSDRTASASKMIEELVRGAGVEGMVSGQVYDIEPEGSPDVEALDKLHRMKTGALICAAVRIGAISAGTNERLLDKLTKYALAVGLAFQVTDDILDLAGRDTGKDTGADASKGKRTYPTMVGMDSSGKKARDLVQEAVSALENFPGPVEPLAEIARYAIERNK